MQILERPVGDVTVLELKGRLILDDGVDAFRDTVDRLVQLGHVNVLLDLDELTYVDSAGLGVMVSKYTTLRKRGGQLKLCNVRQHSFRVLTVTRLLTIFESFDSADAAIESFARPPAQ